jgi:hypothetical protein
MTLTRTDFAINEDTKADSTIKCDLLIEAAKVLADWVIAMGDDETRDEREQELAIEIVLQGFCHENNTFQSAEFQKKVNYLFDPSRAGQQAMFNALIGRGKTNA